MTELDLTVRCDVCGIHRAVTIGLEWIRWAEEPFNCLLEEGAKVVLGEGWVKYWDEWFCPKCKEGKLESK